MSWKKAVFLGGSVLLLAACGEATAPTEPANLTKINGSSASLLSSSIGLPSTTTDTTTAAPKICQGYVIRVGLDGTISVICIPVLD